MSGTTLPLILALLFLQCSDPNDAAAPTAAPWPTTRPACGTALNRLPAGAKATLDAFRQALRDSDWDKALSCCTARVQARANEYPSKEQYLRDFVPLNEFLVEANYRSAGGQLAPNTVGKTGEIIEYYFNLRLSDALDGAHGWPWSLQKAGTAWLVKLPDVPAEEWTRREVPRYWHDQREKEKAKAAGKALEPKLEGLRTHLSAQQTEYRVGLPMLFRLELINEGRYALSYDDHELVHSWSLSITDQNGRRVRCTTGPVQIMSPGRRTIRPNETAILFTNLDIAKTYDLTKPGKYRVCFNGGSLSMADLDPASTRPPAHCASNAETLPQPTPGPASETRAPTSSTEAAASQPTSLADRMMRGWIPSNIVEIEVQEGRP